ncbi:MAG TPA: hypothetical protein VMW46_12355 [Candidatus Desulfaltia sp.]|nr:hypothetical protein [Candidatus Desulfaltia sp.]
MKTNKKPVLIAISLALILFALNSCKSDTISEPSPLGPSSIAVILNLTASPNAIIAGPYERQMATITATLKKYDGIPLAGQTVLFKIDSPRGSLGYFEDKLDFLTKTTDANGTVQTSYYGPLYNELGREMTIYIRATVAWEGSQFISDKTPIYVIRSDE